MVLVPMPSMRAPSATRKCARSCTCGSEAALRKSVVPCAATAAISAFSVAVTLGSSRKTSAPFSRVGAELQPVGGGDRGAELLEGQEMRVETPAADDVAAGRRQRHLAAAGQQRPRQQDRGADPRAQLRIEIGGANALWRGWQACCAPAIRPMRRPSGSVRPAFRCRECAARFRASPDARSATPLR